MKKLLLFVFALTLSLVLLACNGTTTAQPTTLAPTTAAPTTVAPTTVPPTTAAPTTAVQLELWSLYEGTHTVSAMGSEVVYVYEMVFQDGNYYFASEFMMGEEYYTFEEYGTYSVAGSVITMTPEGQEAVTGEILVGGTISVPVKASEMGSRAPREMTGIALSRIYTGTHTVSAMGSEVVYVYQMTFAYGLYTFISEFEMGGETYNYFEVGTYEVSGGGNIAITPLLGEAVNGTFTETTLTIGVKASEMGARAERTLTSNKLSLYYEGTHTVSAMGSDVVYSYSVTFMNGTYKMVSNFTMGEEPYTFEETGTYSVEGNVLTITPEGLDSVSGTINIDYTLTFPLKASSMGARADRVLEMSIPVV